MSGSAHTPGPWRMHDMEPMTVVAVDKDGHGGEVANTLNSLSSHEQADIDARLIAAAPDMLAALKAAQEALFWHKAEQFEFETEGVKVGDQVSAAIAKAEGSAS